MISGQVWGSFLEPFSGKNRSEKQSLSAMGFWSTPRSNLGGLLGVLGALVGDWRAILAQPYSSFCIFWKGSQVTTLANLGSGCRPSWTKKMPERHQKGSQTSEKQILLACQFLMIFGVGFCSVVGTFLEARIGLTLG